MAVKKTSRPVPKKVGQKTAKPSALKKISARQLAVFFVLLIIAVMAFSVWLFVDPSKTRPGENTGAIAALDGGKTLYYNVFGDHFSNDLSVNLAETNLYYDRVTTAFSFPPQYLWSKGEACLDEYCGAAAEDWFYPIISEKKILDGGQSLDPGLAKGAEGREKNVQKYCLGQRCLEASGASLSYQGKKVSLPSSLKNLEILSVAIYPLSEDWLVGFVARDGEAEIGRAYRFSGTKFTELDPKNMAPLESRAGFEGAYFGFGGDDDNFLVLYGAYDLLGYQVVDGEIVDLKQFFGLRTSGGGFMPLALKQEIGTGDNQETVWYLCSRLAGRPRFLKLWQNGSESIKGVLSFSEEFFKSQGLDSAWCRNEEEAGTVEVVVGRQGAYSQYIFQDKGFAAAENSQIVSNNLFTDTGLVRQARFNNIIACEDRVCGEEVFSRSLHFSAGTKPANIEPAEFGREIIFSDPAPGLYWKIAVDAKPERSNYSPWIDGLMEMSYAWEK